MHMKELRTFHGELSPLVDIHEEKRLLELLNEAPKPQIVKKNKYAGNSSYLSIGVIEAQLDRFFGALNWSFVVTKLEMQVNAIVCTGDLIIFYKDRQIRRSGVGASEIQLRAGSKTMDISSISSKAMEKNAPIAKTQALKNAAQSLGDAFGRSLNRDYKHGYIAHDEMDRLRGNIEDIQDHQEMERLKDFIDECQSIEVLEDLDIPKEMEGRVKKRIEELRGG